MAGCMTKIRQTPEAPFRESARAVDLTTADIIVSVGRGIGEKEMIPVAEELARDKTIHHRRESRSQSAHAAARLRS